MTGAATKIWGKIQWLATGHIKRDQKMLRYEARKSAKSHSELPDYAYELAYMIWQSDTSCARYMLTKGT